MLPFRRRTWPALAILAAVSAGAVRSIPNDLAAAIDRLADPDAVARAAAERTLATAGQRAIPALAAVLDDPRPEVAARARRALRQARLFTLRTGDNLDPALALADRYLATTSPANRAMIVRVLAALQPRPVDVIVRLVTMEPDAALRSQLLTTVGSAYRRAVPRIVAEGDAAALQSLLEQSAAELSYTGAPDYAVERQLDGHWDEAVAQWKAELANGDAAHQALSAGILCYLYRVAGQSDAAADMARRTQDWHLILTTALDRADWPAALAAAAGWTDGKGLPIRAALATLAGGGPVATDADAINADPESIGLARTRLLLGDVDGALARLSLDPSQGGEPVAAFGLRQARGDYDAALALANRFALDPKMGPALANLRDDLRRLLGDLPAVPLAPPSAADPEPIWTRALTDLAARRYGAAAADLAPGDGDPVHLDWWYVRGFALDAAGDSAAGQSLMRAASLAPLADTAVRAHLADRLATAGLEKSAADQRSLAIRAASPFIDAGALLDLHLTRESVATAARDYAAAADAAERVWLLSFWRAGIWAEPAPYLTVAADVHMARARLARAKDDWTTAMREIDAYRVLLPNSADVPLEWVPLLDGHGDHAAADAMFAVAADALEAQSARHPRSAFLHNQSAWLDACCCRRLDAALAHAESAVRLDPGNWQFTDTLAECRFRLGDRSLAADLERRALTLPGADGAYLARQIARFAKAEVPSTTRPVDAPS